MQFYLDYYPKSLSRGFKMDAPVLIPLESVAPTLAVGEYLPWRAGLLTDTSPLSKGRLLLSVPSVFMLYSRR